MHPENHLRGAMLMTLSALMFATMGMCIKLVSVYLTNEMIVFFRNFFGLLYLLPWLTKGGIRGLATQHLSIHIWRTITGLGAMYCFFYALAHMQLASAVLLNFSTPLFIPFFALLWLKESIPAQVRWAIIVGFIGIGLILKPGAGMFQSVALFGLASGILAALASVTVRQLSRTEPTTRIVFYYSTISTVISAIPLAWGWLMPDLKLWGLLILIGVLATSGQLLMTRAYAHAPAGRVGPFMYATVVFAAIFGWIMWNEIPDSYSFIGTALVVLAGILAIRRLNIVSSTDITLTDNDKAQ